MIRFLPKISASITSDAKSVWLENSSHQTFSRHAIGVRVDESRLSLRVHADGVGAKRG